MFQENKASQILRKTNISYPLIRTCTSAYKGVRNVRFSENLASFVFLETLILRFAHLPYYRRNLLKDIAQNLILTINLIGKYVEYGPTLDQYSFLNH